MMPPVWKTFEEFLIKLNWPHDLLTPIPDIYTQEKMETNVHQLDKLTVVCLYGEILLSNGKE